MHRSPTHSRSGILTQVCLSESCIPSILTACFSPSDFVDSVLDQTPQILVTNLLKCVSWARYQRPGSGEVINGAAMVTSSKGLKAATHLNGTQDRHQARPGGLTPRLDCIQRESDREEESHQGPPCSLLLSSRISLGMKILRAKWGASFMFASNP